MEREKSMGMTREQIPEGMCAMSYDCKARTLEIAFHTEAQMLAHKDALLDAAAGAAPSASNALPAAPKPMHEQDAALAIESAIQFGREGHNKPPSEDHWLMPYWKIGQQLSAQPAAPDSAAADCEKCKGSGEMRVEAYHGDQGHEATINCDGCGGTGDSAAAPAMVPLSEYRKLQALVTSQGLRLMESEDSAAAPAALLRDVLQVLEEGNDEGPLIRRVKAALAVLQPPASDGDVPMISDEQREAGLIAAHKKTGLRGVTSSEARMFHDGVDFALAALATADKPSGQDAIDAALRELLATVLHFIPATEPDLYRDVEAACAAITQEKAS
jgi:hypothetical protein